MIELAGYAGLRICIAVSGGRDSVALLHYLHSHADGYGITLCALNCDHGIRGEQSARDSAFVRSLCADYGIPLAFYAWRTDGAKTEASARQWRLSCYAAAADISGAYGDISPVEIFSRAPWQGADAVATAHHLNDNAETVIFNLARGSALAGMEGITDYSEPASGLKIIHPLVSVTREEIDLYIRRNGLTYVDDATNLTDDYTRNKIRLHVLPELERAVPGAAKAIYRFSRLAADDEEYFDKLIKERKLIKHTRLGFEIACCSEKVVFKRAAVKALNECSVKDYTSEHIRRLYELQLAENGKSFGFLGYTAYNENGKIVLVRDVLAEAEACGVSFDEHLVGEQSFYCDSFIHVANGDGLDEKLLAFGAAAEDDMRVPQKFNVLRLDGECVPRGAVIRFMREGDRFTKFGGGTKSLGDYFTDKKIPVRVRRRVPLIAEGNDILAVGGVEISEKIKITDKTKKTLFLVCADFGAE